MPVTVNEFKLNPLDGSTTTEYSDGSVTTGSVLPASTLTADDTAKLKAWIARGPDANRHTIGAVGNSIAALYGPGPAGLAPQSLQSTSTGLWAAAATCGRYRVDYSAVYGYGGQTSTYIASQAPTWANFAAETFLHLYENDPQNGVTLAQADAATETVIQALLGKTIIKICTCLPNLSFTTTAMRDTFNAINAMAARKAEKYGIKLVNVSDYHMDISAGGLPKPLPAWVDVSVHPSIGLAQALAYNVLAPSLEHYSASFLQGAAGQHTGKQSMVPNGWFAATSAASGANISGTVPAGWSANIYLPGGSTGSLTCSMRQRSDRVSAQQWCDLRYQSSAGSGGDFALQATNYYFTAGDFAAGDVVEAAADFEITGTPVGLQNLSVRMQHASAPAIYDSNWSGYVAATIPAPWGAARGTLRTQRYTLTAADISAGYLSIYLKGYAISAATPVDCTVGWANPRIVKVA